MHPLVSIIIPCYNSAKYLPEALASIKHYADSDEYEVIIVDDGSSEPETLEYLKKLECEYIILYQENKGPAAARNSGCKIARADYLLFLDSDNKIRPNYIKKGIDILNSDPKIGVVHGAPAFFGKADVKPRFKSSNFSLDLMVSGNYIDMCSVVRKKMWEELGGLDEEKIIIGHEDWDFWIRAGAAGWKFHYVNEILFDYRVRPDSLVTQKQEAKHFRDMQKYMLHKHPDLFIDLLESLKLSNQFYAFEKRKPLRAFIKNVFKNLIR